MWKLLQLMPLALLLSLTACSLEEPTAPTAPADLSSRPVSALAAATLVGSTVVDAERTVGRYASLVSMPDGRQHVTYYDRTRTALKYATCGSGCTTAANWQKVTIAGAAGALSDAGLFSSLEVDATGRRHVIYYERAMDRTRPTLQYATCLDRSNCVTSAGWQRVTIDATASPPSSDATNSVQETSFAITPDGRRHVSYTDRSAPGLKYATCQTNCTVASSWRRVLVDTPSGSHPSIAVGRDGRLHISYLGSFGGGYVLRYATCLTNCTTSANWQKRTIDAAPRSALFGTSLAVGLFGVLHVGYFSGLPGGLTGDLKYARCAADCTNTTKWQRVTVDAIGDAGRYPSIAVGPDSRVHISHHDATTGDLDYASCSINCLDPRNWTSPHVDGKFADVGQYTSLALGGRLVHIGYYDQTNGDLKYLELSP